MRKKSSLTRAKPQTKGKKSSPLTTPLSTPNQRGRQVKTPPSMDPPPFLSSVSASGLKRGRKVLSPPAPIALDISPVSSPMNASTIADLRNLVASRTASLKRHFDLCHNDVMKELAASQTRISKRYKVKLLIRAKSVSCPISVSTIFFIRDLKFFLQFANSDLIFLSDKHVIYNRAYDQTHLPPTPWNCVQNTRCPRYFMFSTNLARHVILGRIFSFFILLLRK